MQVYVPRAKRQENMTPGSGDKISLSETEQLHTSSHHKTADKHRSSASTRASRHRKSQNEHDSSNPREEGGSGNDRRRPESGRHTQNSVTNSRDAGIDSEEICAGTWEDEEMYYNQGDVHQDKEHRIKAETEMQEVEKAADRTKFGRYEGKEDSSMHRRREEGTPHVHRHKHKKHRSKERGTCDDEDRRHKRHRRKKHKGEGGSEGVSEVGENGKNVEVSGEMCKVEYHADGTHELKRDNLSEEENQKRTMNQDYNEEEEIVNRCNVDGVKSSQCYDERILPKTGEDAEQQNITEEGKHQAEHKCNNRHLQHVQIHDEDQMGSGTEDEKFYDCEPFEDGELASEPGSQQDYQDNSVERSEELTMLPVNENTSTLTASSEHANPEEDLCSAFESTSGLRNDVSVRFSCTEDSFGQNVKDSVHSGELGRDPLLQTQTEISNKGNGLNNTSTICPSSNSTSSIGAINHDSTGTAGNPISKTNQTSVVYSMECIAEDQKKISRKCLDQSVHSEMVIDSTIQDIQSMQRLCSESDSQKHGTLDTPKHNSIVATPVCIETVCMPNEPELGAAIDSSRSILSSNVIESSNTHHAALDINRDGERKAGASHYNNTLESSDYQGVPKGIGSAENQLLKTVDIREHDSVTGQNTSPCPSNSCENIATDVDTRYNSVTSGPHDMVTKSGYVSMFCRYVSRIDC